MLPELDTPGHSKGMCAGAPDGVCMANCTANANWPLRPLARTHAWLTELWAEVDGLFPFGFRHVGGDEVETDCWDEDAASVAWMKAHGLNASETYVRFVNANVNLTTAQSKRAVVWNDLWRDYGTAGPSAAVGGVSADAAIMFWTSNPGSFQAAADDGRDVIAASGGPYYLSNR